MKALRKATDFAVRRFSFLLNFKNIKADHKTLSHHIICMNQKKTPVKVVCESARCLKKIASYHLFALAVQDQQRIHAWMDPDICNSFMEKIIQKDFKLDPEKSLDIGTVEIEKENFQPGICLDQMVSYQIYHPEFRARIYMVPGKRLLPHHDEIALMLLESASIALFRQLEIQNLSTAAARDPLTGCYNRREFENRLKSHISDSFRHGSPVSIFMFDLDHFKRVNDRYGHPAGDAVLKEVADLVSRNLRQADVLCRYGGEEFVVVLPRTGKERAVDLADRIREKIMAHTIICPEGRIDVTVSAGVSTLCAEHDTPDALVKAADDMLYKAKLSGRNTVMPGRLKSIPASQKTDLSEQQHSIF